MEVTRNTIWKIFIILLISSYSQLSFATEENKEYKNDKSFSALMRSSKLDIQDSICRSHILRGEYEIAMNEAVNILTQSEKVDYTHGIIGSNENIGLIYLLMGRDKDAIPFLEKSLTLLREVNNQLIYETHIMSYLLVAYHRIGDLDKMKKLLDLYRSKMNKIMPETSPDKPDTQRRASWLLLYSYYINYYVAAGDTGNADEAQQKATSYMDDHLKESYSSTYYLAMSRYYLSKKNYDQAITLINKTLDVDYSVEPLTEKIHILSTAGRINESLEASQQLYELLQKQNTDVYSRQIDQLRTIHDLNEKEKQAQLYQRHQQEITHKQEQLTWIRWFVGILSLLFAGLIYYAYRERMLKNELIQEKLRLRKSSEDLLVAKEEAEHSDHLKSKFVANISHEIRTPLSAITGFSNLLDIATENERPEFIEIINTNSELLLDMVRNIMDLSQLETGQFTLHIQEVNIDTCCENAINAISHRITEEVKLIYTHPDNPSIIQTDSLRVQQILANLLMNAAKYTEKGLIHLDYKVIEEQEQIVFSITDTGCGISQEKQNLIFNNFEKADHFKQGAGLGLTVCREVSAYLGGTVILDPSYTEGARFIFTLNLKK